MNILYKKRKKLVFGFTLIEIMVAVSVFMVVMVISSGSILSVFDANQKSKTLRSVMDNLNITVEGMTRTIRFGRNYNCGSVFPTTSPFDCAGGNTSLTITVGGGVGTQTTYSLSNGRILRNTSGVNYFVTSPDVTITTLTFRVFGSLPYSTPDLLQPKVVILVSGFVGAKENTKTTFTLQTSVSQRKFDFE